MASPVALYDSDVVLIRPGHPGRFAFRGITGSRVRIAVLNAKGKPHRTTFVPIARFKAEYCVARTAEQREIDQAILLKCIHTDAPLPEPLTTRTRQDLKFLRSRDLITRAHRATHHLNTLHESTTDDDPTT